MCPGGQGTKWRRNILENFNRLSRVHERYRRQTDRETDRRQAIAYSEHEREFTFAKIGQYSTGQDRKKSQKGYISPIWGEVPIEAIYIKNCVVSDILDVITCAKFENEIFRGYDITGVEFSIFPSNSAALLAALSVINTVAPMFLVVLSYIITADVGRSYLLSSFVLRQHSAAVRSAYYFWPSSSSSYSFIVT